MHRALTTRVLVLAGLLAGCGATPPPVKDASRVERLRVQITKARNAIAETNGALARARGTPYVTELEVRLAELLSEEARYHYQVAQERESRGGRSERSMHVPQVRAAQRARHRAERAGADAGTPWRPASCSNLAQEHRELGDYDAMHAALRPPRRRAPSTRWPPKPCWIMGDDAFDRGDLAAAAQAWVPITRAPHPGHWPRLVQAGLGAGEPGGLQAGLWRASPRHRGRRRGPRRGGRHRPQRMWTSAARRWWI
ncbi:MAG: hypothetical protein R3F43_19870 [bacterium]